MTRWASCKPPHVTHGLCYCQACCRSEELTACLPVQRCLFHWEVQAERWGQACAEDREIVLGIVEKRFQANYHMAWAASYVLDPLYLLPASSNDRWVPPFEKMTAEQQADAETIIKRLAPADALRAQVIVIPCLYTRNHRRFQIT